MNTKRPFADDKARDKPRPVANGLCELLYPRSKRLHKRPSPLLSLLFFSSVSQLPQHVEAGRNIVATIGTIRTAVVVLHRASCQFHVWTQDLGVSVTLPSLSSGRVTGTSWARAVTR